MRKLPVVDIGGTDFYVDMRLQEFRQVDNLFNSIEFVECMENEKGMTLQYDVIKKTIFHGAPEELKERRLGIRTIQLPPLWKMDPVGWIEFARDSGKAVRREQHHSRKIR